MGTIIHLLGIIVIIDIGMLIKGISAEFAAGLFAVTGNKVFGSRVEKRIRVIYYE